MSDDKRYSEGNELPISHQLWIQIIKFQKQDLSMLGLFTNVLI